MHTNFGYLNQGNPLNIGENEAQACVNCGLDRGWIEYKEYHTNNEEPNISADIGTRHFEIDNGSIKDNGNKLGYTLEEVLNVNKEHFISNFKGLTIENPNGDDQVEYKINYGLHNFPTNVDGIDHIGTPYNPYLVNAFKYIRNGNPYRIENSCRLRFYKIKSTSPLVNSIDVIDGLYYTIPDDDFSPNKEIYYSYGGAWHKENNFKYNQFVTLKESFFQNNITRFKMSALKMSPEATEQILSWQFTLDETEYEIYFSEGKMFVNLKLTEEHTNIVQAPNQIFYFSITMWTEKFSKEDFFIMPKEERRTIPYAVNFSKTQDGIKKETKPLFFNIETYPINNTLFDTTKFKSIAIKLPPRNFYKEGFDMNIYRIPIGGTEFLFDFKAPVTYSNSKYSIDRKDDIYLPVDNALESSELTDNVISSNNVSSIVIHKDMLFASIDNILWFSKQGIFDQFPAKNFFVFQNRITGLVPYNSNLMVLTEKNAYILYGMNEQGFVVAKIDFNNNLNEEHSSRTVYDHVLTCNTIKLSVMEDKSEFTISKINSQYGYDIGNKAKKYLKEQNSTTGNNRVLYNRFYIIKFTRPHATATSSSNLVYDAIKGGFVIYEKPHDMFAEYLTEDCWFRYKTKEYLQDGKATARTQSNKALVVRAKGLVKIRAYGDNEVISEEEIDFGDVVNTKTDISMIPTRYSTFSVEFLGKSKDAQIHGWDICNA